MKKIVLHPHFIPWFLFIFFTTIYFSSTVGTMNSLDGSQYALTQALTEKKTIKIDSYMEWTYWTDYAKVRDHYYSDRDPGLSFLAVPFYFIATKIYYFAHMPYDGLNPSTDLNSTIQALTYLTSAFWGAIGVVVVYLLCLHFGRTKKASLITAISVGIGTLLWKYSAMFYREPVFTTFLLIAYYCIFLTGKKTTINYKKLFTVAGFFAGLSVSVDYSKLFIIIIIYLYILWANFKYKISHLIFFTVGLVLPLALVTLYNLSAFNNIFAVPHQYNNSISWLYTKSSIFKTPFMPSVLVNLTNNTSIPKDVLNYLLSNPSLDYQTGAYWATVWRYRGIFVQTPLLFIAVLGWFSFLKSNWREAVGLLLSAMIIFLINSKLTVFWAGNNYDSRYFLPTTTILLLGLPFFIDNINKIKIFFFRLYRYLLFIFLFCYSLYNSWYSTLTSFAPHVSGEYKFSFTQLLPLYSLDALKYNLHELSINTFPNYYNLHILIVFYFGPILFFFLLNRFFQYLIKSN